MTRSEAYREVLRLDTELKAARAHVKAAQARTRVTGVKLPERDYSAMWDRVHSLERRIEATRLQLAAAEETAAERFVEIVKAEHPALFAQLASRAGIE